MTDPPDPTEVKVHCYAGHRGEETPRHFTVCGDTVRVEEVLKRWSEPSGRGFRVRGDDGRVRTLWWDGASESWQLLPHRR